MTRIGSGRPLTGPGRATTARVLLYRPLAHDLQQGPPSYLATSRKCLEAASPETLTQTTIHFENIPETVLVSGGDDQFRLSADGRTHHPGQSGGNAMSHVAPTGNPL